jgi:opacity protein-like surface antigen
MRNSRKLLLLALIAVAVAVTAYAAEVIGTPNENQYTFGNLGVNTSTPTRPLSVKADSDTGKVLSVLNSTGTAELYSVSSLAHGGRFNMARSNNQEVVQLNTAGTSYITGSNLGINTKTPTAILDVDGTTRLRGAVTTDVTLNVGTDVSCAVLEIRGQGNDLAETFEISGGGSAGEAEVQSGMVVSIDPAHAGKLVLCQESYDRKVAGIVSGAGDRHPGIQLGDSPNAKGEHSVALSGRVWCWVDATTSPVVPGDSLTTSSTPGHAMKASDFGRAQGAIIGKAMTGLDTGKGLVLVLVNLH